MAQSKGFFAVDIVQFEKVRSRNLGILEAATYLTLLAGTDQSNTLSSWGINAIRNQTGFTRAEANRAIDNLVQCGLIEKLCVNNIYTKTEPRYRLPIHENRRALTGKEKAIFEIIASGAQPSNKGETQAAHRAKDKGWLARNGAEWKIAEHANVVAFIPNSFAVSDDANAPLRRLINYGELDPIMLAVELYEKQNLMEHRGLPTELVRRYWKSDPADFLGTHRLNNLQLGRCYIEAKTGKERLFTGAQEYDWRTVEFWSNLEVLETLHIVEWAVYSANGEPTASDEYAFNRPQRPLGVLRNGKHVKNTPEAKPAFLSFVIRSIHRGEVNPELPLWLEDLDLLWQVDSPIVAIENNSVSHVEGVGILRMVHRADTNNCKVWYKDLCEESDRAVFFLEQVIQAKIPQIFDKIDVIRSYLEV